MHIGAKQLRHRQTKTLWDKSGLAITTHVNNERRTGSPLANMSEYSLDSSSPAALLSEYPLYEYASEPYGSGSGSDPVLIYKHRKRFASEYSLMFASGDPVRRSTTTAANILLRRCVRERASERERDRKKKSLRERKENPYERERKHFMRERVETPFPRNEMFFSKNL